MHAPIGAKKIFSIYPKNSINNSDDDRYEKIKEIYFDLDERDFIKLSYEPIETSSMYPDAIPKGICPEGIGRYLIYGLGIIVKYSTIINAIELETNCKKIYISDTSGTEIVNDTFRISREIFEEHIKNLQRQHTMVSSVSYKFKEVASRNLIKDTTGGVKVSSPKFKSPARKAASRAFSSEISEDEFDEVANLFVDSFPSVGKKFSRRIVALQEELMIKSLNSVIEEADRMLDDNVREKKWQKFFTDYQIVLQQVFYAPIKIIQKEAHLKPTNIEGRGAVITDFLTVNNSTRNIILVEVKSPSTPIIANKPYRGKGDSEVYPIHQELAGAISQLQGQIYSAQSHLAHMNGENNSDQEIRLQGSIRGALIIGKISKYSDLQKDSFTRFRGDLHSIEIVTYDELISRLKILRELLNGIQISPDR